MGTVVEVFNSGASDLLRVRLHSMNNIPNQTGKSKVEAGASGPLVWVPFVEAIVPNVDTEKREMLVTPPKGLLELNIRHDERSKKERRELVRHTLVLCYLRVKNLNCPQTLHLGQKNPRILYLLVPLKSRDK